MCGPLRVTVVAAEPSLGKERTLDIRVVAEDVTRFKGDALVVNLYEGVKTPGGEIGRAHV